MTAKVRDILKRCLKFAEANEWQTRHAAENRYCPYCATPDDDWRDQAAHYVDCGWIKLVTDLKQALKARSNADAS